MAITRTGSDARETEAVDAGADIVPTRIPATAIDVQQLATALQAKMEELHVLDNDYFKIKMDRATALAGTGPSDRFFELGVKMGGRVDVGHAAWDAEDARINVSARGMIIDKILPRVRQFIGFLKQTSFPDICARAGDIVRDIEYAVAYTGRDDAEQRYEMLTNAVDKGISDLKALLSECHLIVKLRQRHVMIVEDDPRASRAISQALEKKRGATDPERLVVAASVSEGLSALDRLCTNFRGGETLMLIADFQIYNRPDGLMVDDGGPAVITAAHEKVARWNHEHADQVPVLLEVVLNTSQVNTVEKFTECQRQWPNVVAFNNSAGEDKGHVMSDISAYLNSRH